MCKYLLIPFLVCLISCKDKDVAKEAKFKNQIVFPISNQIIEDETVKISEIVDTTIIVKLETTKECLISRPIKIKIYNEHIFVLDDKNGLLEFDMEGYFIRKIGRFGKGPKEYISARSFDIDESTNEIIIYDRGKLKLLKYNLKGDFEEALKVSIYSSNFIIDQNTGNYIFDTYLETQKSFINKTNKQYSIARVDKKGNISSVFIETNDAQNNLNFSSPYNLFSNGKSILYNIPFKNEVYRLKNDEIIPFLSFEFKGKTIPDKLSYNIDVRNFTKKIEENGYEYFDNRFGYFLINNRLLFYVYREGNYENYIYNFETKKLNLIDLKTEAPYVGFIGQPICVYNNALVSYAQTESYIDFEDYSSDKYKDSRIQEIVKDAKEGDNPIIIFDRMKI